MFSEFVRIFLYLLFPLMEKVTKRSSEFDAQQSLRSESLPTNSHLRESFKSKGSRSKPPLRAMRRNERRCIAFSFPIVQRFPKLTRNKALGKFLRPQNSRRDFVSITTSTKEMNPYASTLAPIEAERTAQQ